jgi:hypothetical protein
MRFKGEPMNSKPVVLCAAAALTACATLAHAEAVRPVTTQDLAGKTICWDDGWRITYAGDGSYFGARGDAPAVNHHKAQWSISEEGVVDVGLPDKVRHIPMTVYPGGRFEIDHFSKRKGLRRKFGNLCR